MLHHVNTKNIVIDFLLSTHNKTYMYNVGLHT